MLGGSCRWRLGPGAEILGRIWKLKREAGEERGEEGGVEQGDALEQVPEEKINMGWRQLTFFFFFFNGLMLSCQMPLEQVLSGMELSDPSEF